ncbi:hypothetical protein KFL_002080260 [Klebsormidium nitens]|uniref:F-box/LRR-repeat protein 15/At3g58940/PEG3-like LRR domain-containing protein n=1 Tax=Klebsormidium nitens TaxID=105231 RepID=A0A1Y1I9T2_KLENI|nr:hypothetical protein KFL_002080260 [Klebsormidium nitens]|eukprot:GAQ84848.1 hypothetical protein KFL_002080260 [Klebsormidium nitens]
MREGGPDTCVSERHIDQDGFHTLCAQQSSAPPPRRDCAGKDVALFSATCRRFHQLSDAVSHLHFLGGKGQGRGLGAFELLVSERVVRATDLRCLKVETRWTVSDLSFFFWVSHVKDTLQKLQLTETRLGENLADRLRTASKCPKLTALELLTSSDDSYVRLEPGFQAGCARYRKLVKLTLEHVIMSDPVLESLLKLCPVLKELELTGVFGLQSPSIVGEKLERLKLMRAVPTVPSSELPGALTLQAPALQGLAMSRFTQLRFVGTSTALYDLDLLDCEKIDICGDPSLGNVQFLSVRSSEYRGPRYLWMWEWLSTSLLRKCPNLWELMLDMEIETPLNGTCPWAVLASLGDLHELVLRETAIEFVCEHWERAVETRQACLPNLRVLVVSAGTMSRRLLTFLDYVLQSAKLLEVLTVRAEWHEERLEVDAAIDPRYFSDLFKLQRSFPKVSFNFELPGSSQGSVDQEDSENSTLG